MTEIEAQTAIPESEVSEKLTQKPRLRQWLFFAIAFTIFFIGMFAWFLTTPPAAEFPMQLEITSGMTAQDIAAAAAKRGIVRSEFLLYAALSVFHDPTNIHAGRYVFSEPLSVGSVARQIASNNAELDLLRVTFPEGIRAKEMAAIAASSSPAITVSEYTAAAADAEGYLFPETYFIPPRMTASELVALQRDTFSRTIEPLMASTTTEIDDVVTLASIVEREANSEESMRIVAGIFFNRLALGMPLQADASIEYVLETPLKELPPGQLASELRELDSPYNTYLYAGLPPTPIGNPGAVALRAVVDPQETDYFYYITAPDGTFHYAKTLEEHTANVARYLRQ